MPSEEVVRRALEAIKRAADYHYFFDNLRSAAWVEPLWEAGLFRKPPPVIREGDYISFPGWPESRYLARVAAEEPELVARVILSMPSTENVRVSGDLAEAAGTMPPDVAVQLVDRAVEWASSEHQLLLSERLGQLAGHLASGGHPAAGLKILRALLQPLPDPRSDEERPFGSRSPSGRMDEWHYDQVVEKQLPVLVDADAIETLRTFGDLLSEALRLASRSGDATDHDRYSYVWRPGIESEGRGFHDITDVLVSAVRDIAVRAVTGDPAVLEQVVAELENRRLSVFRRIALHVLRVAPGNNADLIKGRLTREAMDELVIYHELWLLVREKMDGLDPETQAFVLRSVLDGPDPQVLAQKLAEFRGEEVSQDEIARYAHDWSFRRLSVLRDVLPPESSEILEEWERQYGRYEHPEFLVHMGEVRTGPNSPLSEAELSQLPTDELVTYLRTWVPTGDWMAPSPEGLGRQLRGVVANSPEEFALAAQSFSGLEPTYIRALIGGLEDALRSERGFLWDPVLTLCDWIVAQPREANEDDAVDREKDPGWGWTRKAVASLLGEALDESEHAIPASARERVWRLIEVLVEDPEPTPDYEARYGGSNMDPATLSINTTRGEAMHAAIRYGLWVRRQIESQQDEERLGRGFGEMPELRTVLDRHLDPDQDRSLAVRSVYGQWFPWLILIDRQWAEGKRPQVFPQDDLQKPLREAAWNTYITFCRPYDMSWEVLRDEYEFEASRLEEAPPSERPSEDPRFGLAEHIVTYYWQGKLGTIDEADLVQTLFANAPVDVRARAIEFVGRSLRHSVDEVLPRILDRMKDLWTWRVQHVREADPTTDSQSELAPFGWWFASGKFDSAWALEQLEDAIRLTEGIEPAHLVAERLAEIAHAFPYAAARVLHLMIERDSEGWGVVRLRDEARRILGIALRSDDSGAKEAATNTVHYLGARGHTEFRDLVS